MWMMMNEATNTAAGQIFFAGSETAVVNALSAGLYPLETLQRLLGLGMMTESAETTADRIMGNDRYLSNWRSMLGLVIDEIWKMSGDDLDLMYDVSVLLSQRLQTEIFFRIFGLGCDCQLLSYTSKNRPKAKRKLLSDARCFGKLFGGRIYEVRFRSCESRLPPSPSPLPGVRVRL
jgi:hypothetical protein